MCVGGGGGCRMLEAHGLIATYACYRKHHSTKLTILKVHKDVNIDRGGGGEVTALSLLDLSAAFDTIDHAALTRSVWNRWSSSNLSFFLFERQE